MARPSVFRFEDGGDFRSHVIAFSKQKAIEIFDRVMGREYREECDNAGEMEIYEIDESTLLPVSDDGYAPFVENTVGQWIDQDDTERFL